MEWVKIQNGEIIEKQNSCPRNTKSVSNFYLLSEEEKKTYGWYQVKNNNPQVMTWQKVTNKNIEYNSSEDIVEEIYTIEDVTLEEFKNIKYSRLRNEVKEYIYSVYPDYKQLSALAGFYSTEENNAIKNGVKSLFDVAVQMKTDLYGMETYEEVDVVYFRKEMDANSEAPYWKFWGE